MFYSPLVSFTFVWLLSYSLSVVLHLVIRLGSSSVLVVLGARILHFTVLLSFSSFLLDALQTLFPVNRGDEVFSPAAKRKADLTRGVKCFRSTYLFSSRCSFFTAMFFACFFLRSSFSFNWASFLFRISCISSSVFVTVKCRAQQNPHKRADRGRWSKTK